MYLIFIEKETERGQADKAGQDYFTREILSFVARRPPPTNHSLSDRNFETTAGNSRQACQALNFFACCAGALVKGC